MQQYWEWATIKLNDIGETCLLDFVLQFPTGSNSTPLATQQHYLHCKLHTSTSTNYTVSADHWQILVVTLPEVDILGTGYLPRKLAIGLRSLLLRRFFANYVGVEILTVSAVPLFVAATVALVATAGHGQMHFIAHRRSIFELLLMLLY